MRTFIYIFVILFLGACSGNDIKQEKLLTVTMEPYRYVVEAIAGDSWCVNSIVPKGNNPEAFDPTPRDMTALAESKAYFLVGGLGFERAWRTKIEDMYPGLVMVDTSLGIERDAGDPHLWTSPANMRVIADNVCAALCIMDSACSDEYRMRLARFKRKLHVTDSIVGHKLAECRGNSFMIFHPTLTYFANNYSLNQISIENEGKEPSVAHIRNVIDSARNCGVKYVMVQAEFDRRNAEVIANEIGAEVVEIDPLSYDWHGQMLYIAGILSQK